MDADGDELAALVGDTNIFLCRDPEDGRLLAEIEIMIAEECNRRKGFGWEATLIMLRFSADALKINKFVAKIGLDNSKSIAMFEKLGFTEESRSAIFNEITLVRDCDEMWMSSVLGTEKSQIEQLK